MHGNVVVVAVVESANDSLKNFAKTTVNLTLNSYHNSLIVVSSLGIADSQCTQESRRETTTQKVTRDSTSIVT